MKNTLTKHIYILIVCLLSVGVANAQTISEFCEERGREFIVQAFQELGSACANLSGDGCFSGRETTINYLIKPSSVLNDLPSFEDNTILPQNIASIITEDFELNIDNPIESKWGIVTLSSPANLHTMLPINLSTLLTFGGVRLENGIYPEEVFERDIVVRVSFTMIDLFSQPTNWEGSQQIDTLTGGGTLEADAMSRDGKWVRVFYLYDDELYDFQHASAWARVEDLTDATDIDTLPTLGEDQYTAFQRFYFSNVSTNTPCEAIPNPSILVQGSSSIAIATQIIVNNVDLTFTGAVNLRVINDREMELTVLDGIAIIHLPNQQEIPIGAGETKILCIGANRNLGVDGEANDYEFLSREQCALDLVQDDDG